MQIVDLERLARDGRFLDLIYHVAGDDSLLQSPRERYLLMRKALQNAMCKLDGRIWKEFYDPDTCFNNADLLRCRYIMKRYLHRDDYVFLGWNAQITGALEDTLKRLPDYYHRMVFTAKAGEAILERIDRENDGWDPRSLDPSSVTQFSLPLFAGDNLSYRLPLSEADEKNLTERGFQKGKGEWVRVMKGYPEGIIYDEINVIEIMRPRRRLAAG